MRSKRLPTISYQMAQRTVPSLKAKCPRFLTDAPRGKGNVILFKGSALEKRVNLLSEIRSASPDWEPRLCLGGRAVAMVSSLFGGKLTCQNILEMADKLIEEEMQATGAMQIFADWGEEETRKMLSSGFFSPFDVKYELDIRKYKAVKLIKFLTWGLSLRGGGEYPSCRGFFVKAICRVIDPKVWRIACRNVHGAYALDAGVLNDAQIQQKDYTDLYAIHPLLGRAWVPWVRKEVGKTTGDDPQPKAYARQFLSACRAKGLTRSGIQVLHRLAERHPMRLEWALQELFSTQTETLPALLNSLGKYKDGPWLSRILAMTSSMYVFSESVEDLLAAARIHRWCTQEADIDTGLVMDWVRSVVQHRNGRLAQELRDVTRAVRRPQSVRAAALEWANRQQERWHAAEQARSRAEKYVEWTPILDGEYVDASGWTFRELTDSDSLDTEGREMHHCVAEYADGCSLGKSHIFSVVGPQGERATLEVQGETFLVLQLRGPCNQAVSEDCQKAAQRFAQGLRRRLRRGVIQKGNAS